MLRRLARPRRGAGPAPLLEELIARERRLRTAAAEREGSRRDPDLGHDRDAEGCGAQTARVAGSGGGAVLEDPAEGQGDDDDRRADVPLVGLRALHARPAAGEHAGAAPALRPRGHAAGGRPAPRERAGGRAGDAAEDPRAARGDDRAIRHARAEGDRASAARRCRASWRRARWTCSATCVYNLYGSTEVAWATIATPADLRAAPGTAGTAAAGDGREAARRGRPRGASRARAGGSSSRTSWCSRAIPAAAARRSSTA